MASTPRAVDVDTAARMVDDGAVLLDVRNPDEWEAGHAEQATSIPLGELAQRLSELPDDRPIVVTCKSGMRSAQAVAALAHAGVDVHDLDGGMQAWARSGRSLVTDRGTPGRVA